LIQRMRHVLLCAALYAFWLLLITAIPYPHGLPITPISSIRKGHESLPPLFTTSKRGTVPLMPYSFEKICHDDCLRALNKSFSTTIETADFWRYYILSQNDGIYIDTDVVLLNPEITTLRGNIFCMEYDVNMLDVIEEFAGCTPFKGSVSNFFLFSLSNDKRIWRELMVDIVETPVKEFFTEKIRILANTGPGRIYRFLKKYTAEELEHRDTYILSTSSCKQFYNHITKGRWVDGTHSTLTCEQKVTLSMKIILPVFASFIYFFYLRTS
jgi:mannosyltransferase OCH1-like enzyme